MKSPADPAALSEVTKDPNETRVLVGMATCGISAGARPVFETLKEAVRKNNLSNVKVSQTGCIGFCRFEPVVEVCAPGQEKVTYVNMTAEKAERIVTGHLAGGDIVHEFTNTQN